MPGHVKAGKPGEKDPDPEPYLVVTLEMKREDMQKPFDPRKSYWCPDGKGGYYKQRYDMENQKIYDEFIYAMAEMNERAKLNGQTKIQP